MEKSQRANRQMPIAGRIINIKHQMEMALSDGGALNCEINMAIILSVRNRQNYYYCEARHEATSAALLKWRPMSHRVKSSMTIAKEKREEAGMRS